MIRAKASLSVGTRFADWDSDAGDGVEPMPYRRELRTCASNDDEEDNKEDEKCCDYDCDDCDCVERVFGAAIEFLESIKPPKGAVRYRRDRALDIDI